MNTLFLKDVILKDNSCVIILCSKVEMEVLVVFGNETFRRLDESFFVYLSEHILLWSF